MSKHIEEFSLLPATQSAFRSNFSTETAVLKFLSDALSCFDKGFVTLASFLDLSSAFDCVDYPILLRRLNLSVGLSGSALDWFESFLSNRKFSVKHGRCTTFVPVLCGVPQGSVLGPLLFSLFISDLAPVVRRHKLQVHLFADDILLYGTATKNDLVCLSSRMSSCLDDVLEWLKWNKLLLNTNKTNFMWCHSSRLKPTLPSSIRLGNAWLTPVSSVLYLGVLLDNHLLLADNVTRTSRSCFAMLRRIRSISRSVPLSLVNRLVTSLVLSRLDYRLLSASLQVSRSPRCVGFSVSCMQQRALRVVPLATITYNHCFDVSTGFPFKAASSTDSRSSPSTADTISPHPTYPAS